MAYLEIFSCRHCTELLDSKESGQGVGGKEASMEVPVAQIQYWVLQVRFEARKIGM